MDVGTTEHVPAGWSALDDPCIVGHNMTLVRSTRWRAAAVCAIAITFGEVVAATAQPQRAAFGAFRMRTARMGGTLWIHSLSPFRFDIEVVTRTLGAHNGVVSGGTATLAGMVATFAPDPDCHITFQVGAEVRVTQRGSCQDAGFGAGVDASGRYRRVAWIPVPGVNTGP